MNMFYLDRNFDVAARWHVDRHVVKMPLEAAQVVCTVLHHYGLPAKYKATHSKHPLVVWAKQSYANTALVILYGLSVSYEYTRRYGKQHKASGVLRSCLYHLVTASFSTTNAQLASFFSASCTDPPQCMPDEFKHSDAIQAYRNYYARGKSHLHKWKAPGVKPEWINH